ncbi:hypothetical protein BU23DRAFT_654581 [Bimuria novae-zelandiae CBS 107.79]|uniref:SWI5-dependent HO expression protein 3 n=1 Tax=Bimuria novae-zelandiae CBS 107.79 TaxID=1447943 RepID=A0A6A5VMM4_9PLEO|nr:hypothetical protein BU23DRAFT_654581 [Bimuria novae-zelandiae CBS 107.79]
MRNIFHAGSSRSASSVSAPVAGGESSQRASSATWAGPISVSSVKSQHTQELEETRTMLDFHKGLVQSLGHDLQKCETEFAKIKDIQAEQKQQIDQQQAEIKSLHSTKAHLERKVNDLKQEVSNDEQRITELLNEVNSFRHKNAIKGRQTIDLGGIDKDALISHLQTENACLTQESLDHNKQLQALASEHTHKMQELEAWHDAKLAEHDAEFELQRDDIERLTSDLAKAKSEVQLKHLRDAMAYTQDLGNNGAMVHRDGVEVEYHHLTTLCRIAKAQEEELARLRAANALLKETQKQEARTVKFPHDGPKHAQGRKHNSLTLGGLPPRAHAHGLGMGPMTAPARPLTPHMDTRPATPTTPMTPCQRVVSEVLSPAVYVPQPSKRSRVVPRGERQQEGVSDATPKVAVRVHGAPTTAVHPVGMGEREVYEYLFG